MLQYFYSLTEASSHPDSDTRRLNYLASWAHEHCSVISNLQTRRADHRYELTDGQHPPTGRSGPPGAQRPTQQPARLEWVCHQSGTDRVYINHREHYV